MNQFRLPDVLVGKVKEFGEHLDKPSTIYELEPSIFRLFNNCKAWSQNSDCNVECHCSNSEQKLYCNHVMDFDSAVVKEPILQKCCLRGAKYIPEKKVKSDKLLERLSNNLEDYVIRTVKMKKYPRVFRSILQEWLGRIEGVTDSSSDTFLNAGHFKIIKKHRILYHNLPR